MDANGLNAEQQALLASIMGKSSQAGGGGFGNFGAAAAAASTPAPTATATVDTSSMSSSKMLSQAEIDALIASMNN